MTNSTDSSSGSSGTSDSSSSTFVPPFVGAIDQGTSSTRFILFDSKGNSVLSHQVEFDQFYPHPGWVEHNPLQIMDTVNECVEEVVKQYKEKKIGELSDIKSVGVTNQRETIVVWDKASGKPLYNAIVWCDARTHSTCHTLVKKTGKEDREHLRPLCGLPISTYFSGIKLRWLLDHVPEVKKACEAGTALFGTIDTWLIWNLTGGVHVTDVTNASRTMMMNINTRKWDDELCKFLEVPMNILPTIKSSSEVYGNVKSGALSGLPIAGNLGDQQAAMVGQMCLHKGEAKNTYGTGCFMLYNTGEEAVQSTHGLLTTVGYQLGKDAPTIYALEGSIAVAGSAVSWLKNNFGIISSASEMDPLASKVEDTGGMYFVPAFSGLFAPYWRDDARGVMVGLTQYTNKHHLARATLEAVCFQTREVLDAMFKDSGVALKRLRVDGGMTKSNVMLQIQSDVLGIPVIRPKNQETTAFGAAYAAGLATGVWEKDKPLTLEDATVFESTTTPEQREEKLAGWKKAVARTLDWDE